MVRTHEPAEGLRSESAPRCPPDLFRVCALRATVPKICKALFVRLGPVSGEVDCSCDGRSRGTACHGLLSHRECCIESTVTAIATSFSQDPRSVPSR